MVLEGELKIPGGYGSSPLPVPYFCSLSI